MGDGWLRENHSGLRIEYLENWEIWIGLRVNVNTLQN